MSQKIHRAPRRHQWLVIDKRTVEDVRLTWAARGLLAYLLSRPDDWEVLVKDLIKRGNLKRDGIYTLLRELRAVGYVRYDPTRDAQVASAAAPTSFRNYHFRIRRVRIRRIRRLRTRQSRTLYLLQN
jgi:DNA-binding IclR family transcriptional regulator